MSDGRVESEDPSEVALAAKGGGVPPAPLPFVAPFITSITLPSNSVAAHATIVGGTSALGLVQLDSTLASSWPVTFVSSNPALLAVPASGTFAAGASRTTFLVTASAVSVATPVQITASAFGVETKTRDFTVLPAPLPPPGDTLTGSGVFKAVSNGADRGNLGINVHSTDPNAVLKVYHTSGIGGYPGFGCCDGYAFDLTGDGRGNFSTARPWLGNPRNFTVRSSSGGEIQILM